MLKETNTHHHNYPSPLLPRLTAVINVAHSSLNPTIEVVHLQLKLTTEQYFKRFIPSSASRGFYPFVLQIGKMRRNFLDHKPAEIRNILIKNQEFDAIGDLTMRLIFPNGEAVME